MVGNSETIPPIHSSLKTVPAQPVDAIPDLDHFLEVVLMRQGGGVGFVSFPAIRWEDAMEAPLPDLTVRVSWRYGIDSSICVSVLLHAQL